MRIHYEESGKGNHPTLVLVHGAGGSSATWFMQIRGLSSDLWVRAIDLNGHGRSPDRSPEDVFGSYLEEIDWLVRDSEPPVVLGGHSMGGALAQLYALRHPERLAGLVLIGTGARLRVAQFIFDLLDNDFDGYVEAVGQYMFAEGASEELIEATKAEVRKCPVRVIQRDFEACNTFDIMPEVGKIAVPTLIIVGSEDVLTPVKYADYLEREIPDSKLVVIEGAGHSVMFERPADVNRAILQWIREKAQV